MSDNRNLDFLKGLLIGGLIGAAAGILFAPKSGRETREEISKKTQDLLTKAREEYETAVEKGKKAYEVAVERAKDVQSSALEKAVDAQEKVTEWMEKGKETLGDTKSRFKKAVDAGIDAYKEEKEKS